MKALNFGDLGGRERELNPKELHAETERERERERARKRRRRERE